MLLQKLSACELTASCNWVNLSAMSRVCNISYFPVAQYYVMRYFILFKKTIFLAPGCPHNCWPTPYHNHQLIRVDLSVFGKYYLTQFHFHCWLFCWIALLSLLSSRMMVASASGLAPCVRLFSWQMREQSGVTSILGSHDHLEPAHRAWHIWQGSLSQDPCLATWWNIHKCERPA